MSICLVIMGYKKSNFLDSLCPISLNGKQNGPGIDRNATVVNGTVLMDEVNVPIILLYYEI